MAEGTRGKRVTGRKKAALLGLCLFGLISFCLTMRRVEGKSEQGLVLNEVCAHNFSIIEEKYRGYSDYIEVYNAGTETVDLKGYGLSDKRGEVKYSFPEAALAPGSFMLVFAVGEELETEEAVFADFCISDNDTVYLTDAEGRVLDSVSMVPTADDIVLARTEDGAGDWETMSGTPYESNEKGKTRSVASDIAAPVLSAQSGFYEEEFLLEIDAGENMVYYTTDGSLPTTESQRYSGPIRIADISGEENVYRSRDDFSDNPEDICTEKVDKAVVVRAVSVNEQGEISRDTIGTYFVGKDYSEKYANYLVVSLTADPDDLFGEDGIYVLGEKYAEYLENLEKWGEEAAVNGINANFLQRGREWERRAWLECFDVGGNLCHTQLVGLRINGSSTRFGAVKSFKIYARERYDGNCFIDGELLPGSSGQRSLVLRHGIGKSQFLQSLAESEEVATQNYQPCILFLNGEFWGEYCIQERISREFVAGCYGLEPEKIIFRKGEEESLSPYEEGFERSCAEYEMLQESIESWYASGEDCYAEIDACIDIQSYMDYLCYQIFFANGDFSDHKNAAIWKYAGVRDEREKTDGRWRWILFDLDLTLEDVSRDSFRERMPYTEYVLWDDPLFASLMRSDRFREDFVHTLQEMCSEELDYVNIMQKLKEQEGLYGSLLSDSDREFIKERETYLMEYVSRYFGEENEDGKEYTE